MVDLNKARPQREYAGQVDERPRIESALNCIDPHDREAWLKVGMAVKAELGESGFQMWDDWSRTAENYNERDAQDVWRSFGDSGPVGLGTLFHLAREAGWNDSTPRRELTPEQVKERRRSRAEAERKDAEETARQQVQTAAWTASIWEQAGQVLQNRYLERKQIASTATLKQIDAAQVREILGYTPKAGGEPLTGSLLVVPMRKAGSPDLCSVELIDEIGRKAALPGRGTKAGAYWLTEKLDSPTSLLIGEGVATTLSAAQATDVPGIAALSATNLKAVAVAMREQFPDARITLLADLLKDTGESDPHAVAAAQAVGGLLAKPDFGPNREPGQKDFNDLQTVRGVEVVRQCIEAAQMPQAESEKSGLTALRRDDLMATPDIDWIVKGVMPSQGIGVTFGPSTVGKSFVMLDLAAHLADGREWFGRRVKPRPVIYACLEGQQGFKRRVAAWETYHSQRYPDGVIFAPDQIDIRTEQDTSALVKLGQCEAGPGAVVIVDTLNRAAPGMEENGSVDYGLILASAGRIAQELQGFVCFVGHPGKDASRGLRGHYSMFAGLDMALEIEEVNRDELSFVWITRKVKDGQDGMRHHFQRQVVNLGEDADGDPVTSCVIIPDPEADSAERSKAANISRTNQERFESFRQAAMEHGTIEGGQFVGLEKESWRKYFYEHYRSDSMDAKRRAFNVAIQGLGKAGLVYEKADGLFQFSGSGAEVQAEIIREAIEERARQKGTGDEAPLMDRIEPNTPNTPNMTEQNRKMFACERAESEPNRTHPFRGVRCSPCSGHFLEDLEETPSPGTGDYIPDLVQI